MHNLDKLINLDYPFCLYCNSRCDIASWGNSQAVTETYVCLSCKEKFEFIYADDKLISIIFTCNEFQVIYTIDIQSFGIKKIEEDQSQIFNRIWVPEFEINFKNKDILNNRLATYLLLS
jgi:DNA-directed RNA polymerase subunit RPC12/RpoP